MQLFSQLRFFFLRRYSVYFRGIKLLEGKMTGIERIATERKRQVEEEGFDMQHDSEMPLGNMARAAVCYAIPEKFRQLSVKDGETRIPLFDAIWPWTMVCWKPAPDNRIRELEKAGALIAAEIDRLSCTPMTRDKTMSIDKTATYETVHWLVTYHGDDEDENYWTVEEKVNGSVRQKLCLGTDEMKSLAEIFKEIAL
jgi:hypothetical protein